MSLADSFLSAHASCAVTAFQVRQVIEYCASIVLMVVLYALATAHLSSRSLPQVRASPSFRYDHLEDFFESVASCCIYCCTLAFVAAEDLLAASAFEAEGTDCVHDSIDVTFVVER